MGRTVALVGFVAAVFAAGVYCAARPTYASGDVLAQDLVEANGSSVESMKCDDHVPVGAAGARFRCMISYKNHAIGEQEFTMDREGMIHAAKDDHEPAPKVKRTADPWGD
ncbi:MAG TPA: hypothetical protein VMJ10_35170 [Kofleriaceae bacterium]|nr:hypothetical protein [Kofleriaceae bacterium]